MITSFLRIGLEQSFFNSIYPSSIASTKRFGSDSVKLIGIYGVCNGLGQMVGALMFGWLCKRFVQNRSKVYAFGFAIHLITFVLIFLNHPILSTVQDTYSPGIIEPR